MYTDVLKIFRTVDRFLLHLVVGVYGGKLVKPSDSMVVLSCLLAEELSDL